MKRTDWVGKPAWVFQLWALGISDEHCAADKDYPVGQLRRTFWRIRGAVLTFVFGWWWWKEVEL